MLHHATMKKLAERQISIVETPEGSDTKYEAFWPNDVKPGQEVKIDFFHDDPKVLATAILAARMAALEYHVTFDQQPTGNVTISVGIKKPRVVGEVANLNDLASAMPDVLEELTPGEADEIEEADDADLEEAEQERGSVVPDVYKKRYAEAGHPGTCGDWLAGVLDPLVTGANGKLDPDAMEEVARLNGVDTSKLNRTTPGWQGRFRMTARNMLVKVICKTGHLNVPATEDGDQIKAPEDWVRLNSPKPKEAGNGARTKTEA